MDLLKDIEFTSDMLIDLIVKFRSNGYPEQLNSFGNDEILYTLDEETLRLKIKKSFGTDLEKLSTLMKVTLNHANFAIYIANGANQHPRNISMG